VNAEVPFIKSCDITTDVGEGHSLKLSGKWFKTDKRKHFFYTAVSESLEFHVLKGCGGRQHQQVQKRSEKVSQITVSKQIL